MFSGASLCADRSVLTAERFPVFMNERGKVYFDENGYPNFPVIPGVSDMTNDADAVTIPNALKPFGYVIAHIGKWHTRGLPVQKVLPSETRSVQ